MQGRLLSLKVLELQRHAITLGLPVSGTKAVLIDRLQSAVRQHRLEVDNEKTVSHESKSSHAPKDIILSIDMGLRNLAHCKLSITRNTGSLSQTTTSLNHYTNPLLTEWAHTSVTRPDASGKESFDPSTLARYANQIVEQHVLVPQLPPSVVLIERQRFRSGGGSAVQEWTLRVNMFEAMIWAILCRIQRAGRWHGQVYAVNSGAVARWATSLPRERTDSTTGSQPSKVQGQRVAKERSSKQIKRFKIDLVKSWLAEQQVLKIDHSAQDQIAHFMDRGSTNTGKADDMADALVQGIAWLQWKRNTEALSNHL